MAVFATPVFGNSPMRKKIRAVDGSVFTTIISMSASRGLLVERGDESRMRLSIDASQQTVELCHLLARTPDVTF